jgi:hypothetical protein
VTTNPSLRRSVPILVTGTGGAGKSTLVGAVFGRVTEHSIPTTRSAREEVEFGRVTTPPAGGRILGIFPRRRRRAGDRITVVVAPGQHGTARTDAYEGALGDGHSPTGVIHVVCWGYNQLWVDQSSVQVEVAATRPSPEAQIEHLRAGCLDEELRDFQETRARIATAWQQPSNEKRWLVLAICKADLYWHQRHEAVTYYTAGPFKTQLDALRRSVPGDVRMTVLPVSAQPLSYVPSPARLPHCRLDPIIDFAIAQQTISQLKAEIWKSGILHKPNPTLQSCRSSQCSTPSRRRKGFLPSSSRSRPDCGCSESCGSSASSCPWRY